MVTKARFLFIYVLLAFISGCTTRPVFTVEVYSTPTVPERLPDPFTETPDAVPTIPPVPTFTPISAPFTTPTPTEGSMPANFSPILYGKRYYANTFYLLLGGVQNDVWLTPDQAASQFRGAWNYDVHTLARGSFEVYGYAPQFSPTSKSYFLGTDSLIGEVGMVGVARGWPVRQGDIQELSVENETYRQVVLDWLEAHNLPDPELGMLHIFRVDLEGDGMDEVFISATHLDDSQHYTKAGDYSVILMRKIMGNEAVTTFIKGDLYVSPEPEITLPNTYSLVNFIDLNQDGVLEVVVGFERWENFGAFIYQIKGQEVKQVPG